MPERQNPWTHWLRNNTTGGKALLADFSASHNSTTGRTTMGLIPIALICPLLIQLVLQALVDNNNAIAATTNNFNNAGGLQEFQTGTIEGEVTKSSGGQPTSNATPGTSASLDGRFSKLCDRNLAPSDRYPRLITT